MGCEDHDNSNGYDGAAEDDLRLRRYDKDGSSATVDEGDYYSLPETTT